MYPLESITGILLAGGQGSRMGGLDKGLLNLGGMPLIEHTLHRLRPQVSRVVISANRHIAQYKNYHCEVIADTHPGYAGPLAGVLAVMSHTTSSLFALAPCDMPHLPHDYVCRLYQAMQNHNAVLAYAHDGMQPQPLVALLRTELQQDLATYLHGGTRKVRLWYARHHAVSVDFTACAKNFDNLNTPMDLTRLKQNVIL